VGQGEGKVEVEAEKMDGMKVIVFEKQQWQKQAG